MFTVPGDLYHSKHTQGQEIEAWRHSFSHKFSGNIMSPVIATSPDGTIVLSFDVLSVSPVTRKRRTKTGSGGVVAFFSWHVVANYALSPVIATSPDSIVYLLRSKMFTFPR